MLMRMKLLTIAHLTALLAFIVGQVIPEDPANRLLNLTKSAYSPFNTSYSSLDLHRTAKRWTSPELATEEQWDRALCKGAQLLEDMLGTDQAAGQNFKPSRQSAQSPWTDPLSVMDTWKYFWVNSLEVHPGYAAFDDWWGVATALKAMKLSDKSTDFGGKNRLVYVTHGDYDQDSFGNPKNPVYYVNGRWRRYTGAFFAYAINPLDGVIIAQNRLGPYHAANERKPKVPADQVPPFYRSSDISWAMWLKLAGSIGQLTNIKYYFSLAISNELTSRIIARALKESGDVLSPFPGKRYWTNLPEGQALLATPNAVGMAYFLIEHKKELGNMFIDYVSIFQCDNDILTLCAMFEISPDPSGPLIHGSLANISRDDTFFAHSKPADNMKDRTKDSEERPMA